MKMTILKPPLFPQVYGEKKVLIEGADSAAHKIEYRVWNPFRS